MVNDLATIDPTSNTIGLTWTATGDDGDVGHRELVRGPLLDLGDRRRQLGGGDPRRQRADARAGRDRRGDGGAQPDREHALLLRRQGVRRMGQPRAALEHRDGTTLPPPTGQVAPTSVSDDLFTGQQSDHAVDSLEHRRRDARLRHPGAHAWASRWRSTRSSTSARTSPIRGTATRSSPAAAARTASATAGPTATSPAARRSTGSTSPATGTPVAITGDDDTSDPIPLGFNTPFYGTLFGSIQVCTNGWLSFTSTATSYSNQPLPNSGAPENLVAPFWDDQDVISGGQVFFQSFGNRAIVQWNNVPHHTSGGPYTYQAIHRGRRRDHLPVPDDGDAARQRDDRHPERDQDRRADGRVQPGLHARRPGGADLVDPAVAHGVPDFRDGSPPAGRRRSTCTWTPRASRAAPIPASSTSSPTIRRIPTSIVNASLHVIGAPDAGVQPASLAYGTSFLGQPYAQTLIVANNGTDTLHVSGITSSHPGQLTADPNVFNLPPHGSQNVTVTWTPAPSDRSAGR